MSSKDSRDSYDAIVVENISKKYLIGGYYNQTLSSEIKKWLSGNKSKKDEIWALKDISFTVTRGEILGIIGNNGAGKSTLLKILSKITPPTSGRAELRGRMSCLLEVGTGFHPELTGSENIYLNGILLGMNKNEIKDKFDEIVEFSGIEKFINTPVKKYSSGMYARLAFSIAAHLNSDILLVDEILAVGDFKFQKKCLGKLSNISNSGKTVIYISHNLNSIKSLCDKSILLENGIIRDYGDSRNVVDQYLKMSTERSEYDSELITDISMTSPESGKSIVSFQDLIIKFTLNPSINISRLILRLEFYNIHGQLLFICNNRLKNKFFELDKEIVIITCHIKSLPLLSGEYYFRYRILNSFEILEESNSHIFFSVHSSENVIEPSEKRGIAVDYDYY